MDPDSNEAAVCTIHNFPNNITHCIVYANSEFKGIFDSAVEDLIKWQGVQSESELKQFVDNLTSDPSSVKGRF